MKIGVISRSNLDDRLYWSGAINSVYTHLKKNKKIKIIKIDKLNNTIRKIAALKRDFIKYVSNIKYDESYDDLVSRNFGYQIEKKLINKKFDFLLAFDSSLIANLSTRIPIILWTDLLYSDYYDHYFNKEKISKKTKKSIKNIEKLALIKSNKVFLSSKWALNKAKKKYPNISQKFKLLEFGPSLISNYNRKFIKKKIKERSNSRLNLITLSVNWKRKGIDRILSINNIINKKGIKTKLTILGLKEKKIKNKNIRIVNFINKNNKNGEKKISNYLLKNHFHLLLSNAEAYGISLIEANSRGVPNIALKVGGMNQIIKNNVNGKLFHHNSDLNKISDYIIETFLDKKKYKNFSLSSYDEYNKNFSYKKIILKFIKLINN